MTTSQNQEQNEQQARLLLPVLTEDPTAQQNSSAFELPSSEDHSGNITIFRTAQFFVHTVATKTQLLGTPRVHTGNTSLLEQLRWISTEQQRVSQAPTRLLPQVELINPVRREISIPAWFEALVVLAALALIMAVHYISVFGFPLYQQSEGLLMSNAWAISHGMLQPYPYIYSQSPLGWIQIAGWTQITGGFATFGNAIDSGRVFMLLFLCGSAVLVYMIACRLSGSRSAGLLAMLLFSLSPLGITYQREVLLENIGIFWLLLSLYCLACGNSRLFNTIFAAIALGIAILTQEVFVIFVPALCYAAWLHATSFQRKFAMVSFIYLVLSLMSLLALLAILKGELLPTGVLPWDHHPHPSLWEGIVNHIQSSSQETNFADTWHNWMRNDWLLFCISALAVGFNLLGGAWNRLQWLLASLLISFWIFLVVGGILLPAYLVILLPLMAMNVVVALQFPLKWLSRHVGFDVVRVLFIFGLIGAITPLRVQDAQALTFQNVTSPQVQALAWIRGHVPQDNVVVVDSYLYADLHDGNKPYPHVHLYWNVVYDPEIHYKQLHDDWQKIDYIVMDSHMQQDLRDRSSDMILIDRALHHSQLLTTFGSNGSDTAIQIYQVVHV